MTAAPRKIAHLTTVDLSLRYLLLAQIDASLAAGDEVIGISAGAPTSRSSRPEACGSWSWRARPAR